MNIPENIPNSLVVASQQEWREWLAKNHDTEKETWLIFYKKHTGKPCINNLAGSYQRNYLGWICSAKKEETRQRRVKEVMELLAQNKKLGLK
jgi:uncharacterized protein YdeI (YjbR/CyaY-like superfamily)